MKNNNLPDWYKIKKYCHIDAQFSKGEFHKVYGYVRNKENIKKHSFLPFIHREVTTRKFRRKNIDGNRSLIRVPDKKTRHIHYCSHLDAKIYSYYKELIQKKYEEKIESFSDCITAYRKIKGQKKSKNNVDFAKEVFDYIKFNKCKNLYVFTADISNFFDGLSHKILKDKWKYVMDFNDTMDVDHYQVYKNITKFSYLEEKDIFKLFKDRIKVERQDGDEKVLKEKPIGRRSYMKNQRAVAFCDLKDIKEIRENNLIKANKWNYDKDAKAKTTLRTVGIPQGSPISALLANVYMLDFDKKMFDYISDHGLYRRYSDDIIIIVPIERLGSTRTELQEAISKIDLIIKDEKTQEFRFDYNEKNKRFDCLFKDKAKGVFTSNKKLEYLGFEFDGDETRIKSSSLASFYRKMKRTIKRGKFYSKRIDNNTRGKLFKRRLYKRFTFKGAKRRVKHLRHKHNPSVFIPQKFHDWGNYLTYAFMAKDIMDSGAIKRQLRRSWTIFHKELWK